MNSIDAASRLFVIPSYENLGKATSCDLCSEFAEPSCVYACPHDAAHRVNPRQFFAGLLQQSSDKSPKD